MNKKRKTLGRTILITCLVSIIVASMIVGNISFSIYVRGMMDHYRSYLTSVLSLAMTEIDGNDLKACIETGTKSDAFERTQDFLNRVRESYDIQYIYIVKPLNTDESDNMMNVMAGITAQEVQEDEAFYSVELGETTGTDYSPAVAAKYLAGMDSGNITFFTNKTEYGADYTGQIRICDSDGDPVAILAADVSISELSRTFLEFMIVVSAVILLMIPFMMLIIYRWLKKRVINPTKKLVQTSKHFVESSRSTNEPSQLSVLDPGIHTGDEMEALSTSLMSMFTDMKRYMCDLLSVTREKERIGAELSVATTIQSDMLPSIFPAFEGRNEFDLFASMDPAKEVGGDFYDFFLVDDDHLALVIADVSGKGVPAALFMVIAKTLIKNRALMGGTPAEILSDVNDQLCADNQSGMFVTVWLAIIELPTGKGIAANAGHEHPVLRRAGSDYELVEYLHSPVIAFMKGIPYEEHPFQLYRGDRLFVYTDGVTEATNAAKELYGTERMVDALNAAGNKPPRETLLELRRSINDFVGDAPQFDDITMLCLDYFGTDTE